MLRHLVPLLLIACSDPRGLAIDRVVPDQADVGVAQPVTIEGTFHALTSNLDNGDTQVALVTASVDTMPLADATWIAQDRVTATMPGLPEGVYDVTVSLDGRSATLPNAYVVGTPPTDGGGNFTGTHQITIDGPVTGGPHTDFPLLVDLQDDLLRTTANGGEVANDQGFDIFFSLDAAGTMRLSHELEKYDGAGGELVTWVKMPTLDTGGVFFIHMGDTSVTTSLENIADVWTNGYRAVWHMTDTTDATGNNTSSSGTDLTSDANGQIELGEAFNGTTSSIAVAASAAVDNIFDGGATIEAWVFAKTAGENNFGRVFEKGGANTLSMCDGQGVPNSVLFGQAFSVTTINWCTNANVIAPNTWFHVAAIYDASSTANRPQIFINGTSVQVNGGQPSGTRLSDAGTALFIGDREAGTRAFDGSLDEARLAATVRSAGWVQTTFANQNNPNNFVTLTP